MILTRCIDLSMAANLALSPAWSSAMLNAAHPGLPIPLLIACRHRRSALLLGAINGLLVWKLDIPSIVVTLGTLTIYRGTIFLLSGGALGQCRPDERRPSSACRAADLLGIPMLSWFAIVVIAICSSC